MDHAKYSEIFNEILKAKDRRNFVFLPTIDFYIFREFIIIYICCLFTFSMLFLIGDMTSHLGTFLRPEATFMSGVSFFLTKQPGELVFILPLALMLSCLYTMAKLGMHSEITAMRASGISLIRCGLPIYIAAFITTGLNFWFSESFVPNCNMKSKIILESVSNPDYIKQMSTMLMYRSPDNKRTWLVKSFETMQEQNDIQLKRYDDTGRLQVELYAPKAYYSDEDGWKFANATLIKYKDVQVNSSINSTSTGEKPTFTVRESSKIPLLDKRNSDFELLGKIKEKPIDIFNTIKQPEEITTRDLIRKLSIGSDLDDLAKNTLQTELASRFAFPWVCLIAVMFSVPIAGKNVKKGVMVSVLIAVGIMLIYLTVSKIFLVFGSRGFIPPYLAGTIPTIILGISGFFYLIRNK